MFFRKLPSNSKKLLDEILAAENPADMLRNRFKGLSSKEDEELRGIIRELKELGHIDVKWADNVPYYVTINNSAILGKSHKLWVTASSSVKWR